MIGKIFDVNFWTKFYTTPIIKHFAAKIVLLLGRIYLWQPKLGKM